MEIINLSNECSSCSTVVSVLGDADDDARFDIAEHIIQNTNDDGTLSSENLALLQCPECHKYVYLKFHSKCYSIGSLLKYGNKDGIHELEDSENPLLVLLLNVCYNACEREVTESPFLASFLYSDVVKLIWKDGQAVGFFVVKVKGTVVRHGFAASFTMPMLDVVYIRKSCRRQGLGRRILKHLIDSYPGQDVGFTEPVSDSLMKVLEAFLEEHPSQRENLWACTYTGEEGYKKNIWLDISRTKRLQQSQSDSAEEPNR